MNATLNGTASLLEFPIAKAAVIYDDYFSGCRAKAFFDQLTAGFDGETRPALVLWRMDALASPDMASEILRDFGCADALVLALRNETVLPAPVLEWVESWARSRVDRNAALIVLRVYGGRFPAPSASLSQLRQVAVRRGLKFFCEWVDEPRRKSLAHGEHLRLYAQATTPSLLSFVE